MAQNKAFRFGPVALTNSAANLLNPGVASGGVRDGNPNLYIILRHISIVNKTGGAVTFSLYLGVTTGSIAGTEVVGTAYSIAANQTFDWRGAMRLDVADFLTGLASANTSLTIEGEGEIGVAG